MQHKFRLVREKVSEVCDRTRKVEVLKRIQELAGSLKGIWESSKRVQNRERVRSVVVCDARNQF